MYKFKAFISCIVLLTVFWGCSPKIYVYKTNWQGNPITIDGHSYDWRLPLSYSDPDTKLNYSVSNDNNNLYIFIETNEDATVTGITRNGLQIWIDTTGKKNHEVGILCPMPQRPENASANGQRQRRYSGNSDQQQSSDNAGIPDTAYLNRIHHRFLERAKQMHVSGFKTIPDGMVNLPDTSGIDLGVSWDNSNYLLYEVAIPLKSFFKYPLLPSDSSRIISISLNFTSIPKGSNNRNGGGGGGIHPSFGIGMMGGMGMMGMSTGGGGMRGGGGTPEPEAKTLWRPFHLSTLPRYGY